MMSNLRNQSTSTVSPRLIAEGGLSREFTSHGLYGENVFQTDRHSIQLNYVFRIRAKSLTYKPRGFLS